MTIEWMQTPERGTWRAAVGDTLLTVSKISTGNWVALVEGPGVSERSLEQKTRLAAQHWAEVVSGVAA